MPEIGEVSRIVHFIRKHLVSRRIANVKAAEDSIVYGKVGTTAEALASALKGKTIVGAKQQGKYFWLEMDTQPHALMHFGMSGWMKFSNEETFYYSSNRKSQTTAGNASDDDASSSTSKSKSKKAKKADEAEPEWPPKYWKFILDMDESDGKPACSAAFIDARRLARIRLVDVAAEEMRNTTPLKENGPDPVIDKHILTVEWLQTRLAKKRVPIKAYLLDQANISGIGNWVGDEILYNAKIHPEQYSNTLSAAQVAQLHESMSYVCGLAVEKLADSKEFPEDWLFKHRWSKGKKGEGVNVLPNGEKIEHITVGGRTSAIVPSVQKKTGPVAGDVEDGNGDDDGADGETRKAVKSAPKKAAKKGARKAKREVEDEDESEASASDGEGDSEKAVKSAPNKAAKKGAWSSKRKVEEDDESEASASDEESAVAKKPPAKKGKTATPKKSASTAAKANMTPAKRASKNVEVEDIKDEDEEMAEAEQGAEEVRSSTKRRSTKTTPSKASASETVKTEEQAPETKGRRRSARNSKG